MLARRVALATAAHGLDALHDRGNDGRLGPLLAPSERERALASRASAFVFRANRGNEAQLLGMLPAAFDRIDEWIEAGVLGGEALNAADFMIAPSLALLAYRPDLRPQIAARACGALLDRVLPET